MQITAISDLHGHYPQLEGGDLLIVAGDLTASDTQEEYKKFLCWANSQSYKKVIFIAGNHDNYLVGDFSCMGKMEYLCDSGTQFEYEEPFRNLFDDNDESFVYRKKLKIWGSPWTKTFPGMNPQCMAFTVDTEEELAEKWKLIPDDIEILVTHGPPYGILDTNESGENCGSISLRKHIENIMPEMVIFGHIHENCGKYVKEKGILYINGSIVDERYRVANSGRRVMFEEKVQQMSKSNKINRFFCQE